MISVFRRLYDWTLKWAKHPQCVKALCFLSFLETIIFPLPVDPLLLTMAFSKPERSLYYAFLTTLFSVLGACTAYAIGFYSWSVLSPWFVDYIFSRETFDSVTSSLQKTAFVSIFVAGFSPIPFKIFTLSAGVIALPLTLFVSATILSRGLRYFILCVLVFKMGEKAQDWIERNFEKTTYAFSVLLILFFVLAFYTRSCLKTQDFMEGKKPENPNTISLSSGL